MRRWAIVALATGGWGCVVVAGVACGFDAGGLGAPGDDVDGGSSGVDASASRDGIAQEVSVPFEAGPCVAASVPPGWSVVEYEAARLPCPKGSATHAVVTSPVVAPGACTCTCANDMAPSCTTGSATFHYSYFTSICQDTGSSIPFANQGCVGPVQGSLAPQASLAALPVTGGHCTTTLAQNPALLTAANAGLCPVDPADAEGVCRGVSTTGFQACITTAGEQACPAGPFSTRYLVYDTVSLACGACGACGVSGTCANARAVFYGNGQMGCDPNAVVMSVKADGACHGLPSMNDSPFKYVDYYADLVPAMGTCKVAQPAAGFVSVTTSTVCCRN